MAESYDPEVATLEAIHRASMSHHPVEAAIGRILKTMHSAAQKAMSDEVKRARRDGKSPTDAFTDVILNMTHSCGMIIGGVICGMAPDHVARGERFPIESLSECFTASVERALKSFAEYHNARS